MNTIPRIEPQTGARAPLPKLHQRALTRLGISPETAGTPKVVRSLPLNVAGLQVARTLLAHVLHRRRTRNRVTSDFAVTLAEEGIVVIPDFLPSPVFAAVQVEFRRALEQAASVRLEKTTTTHVAVQYEDSSKRMGRFEEGVIDHDYVTVLPNDSNFPMIREHLLKNERLLGLVREVSGFSQIFPPRGDLDRMYLSHRADSHDPQTEFHEDIFCNDWRAWFSVNEWTEENAAMTYAPRSHRMSVSRLAFEYWNSVTNTRDGGSWRAGPGYRRWLGVAGRSMCCPPNTLVLGNMCGYHARGAFQQGQIREAIQMSFRHNPWRRG